MPEGRFDFQKMCEPTIHTTRVPAKPCRGGVASVSTCFHRTVTSSPISNMMWNPLASSSG